MFGEILSKNGGFNIRVKQLKAARPENLIRLANALSLRTEGMRHGQIARLVRWRITRATTRFDNAAKRAEYVACWEKL